ncbi:MAG: ComF family protein [Woeseia sp.]
MQRYLKIAANMLAPPYCVFCGTRLGDRRVCAPCHDDLPWLEAACPGCAEPLASAISNGCGPGARCGACQRHPPPWSACRAALHYSFPVDSALKALKFRACLYYAPAFAALLAPIVSRHFNDVDALVPVPLHRLRQARRGFNQAREIAQSLGRTTGLPVQDVARRVRQTASQSGLDRDARSKNLRGAFRVAARLPCRYPLIIDDVMTTGETCRHLASVLLQSGARRIAVLTVARAATPYAAGGVNV